MELKNKLPVENLKIMSRIVNASPGIPSFDKCRTDYRKHKKRLKTLQKIEKKIENTGYR